jgi:hypothetical protein
VYSRVSTELAAYKNVEMERAKNPLERAPVGVRLRRIWNLFKGQRG